MAVPPHRNPQRLRSARLLWLALGTEGFARSASHERNIEQEFHRHRAQTAH